jgi:two-component system, NtrC family, nitrogen regulation response regulator NtrX
MKPARLLVVDDEPGIRQSLCGVLGDEGYQALPAASGEQCLEELARDPFELVFLDVWLPGMDGMETLARIQEIPFPDRPVVVMISGHGNIETAVKATKLGAYDFLEKPLSIQKLSVVAKNALAHRRLELENIRLRGDEDAKYRIIGDSVPMKALRQQMELMAATNGRVLIYGESGTGKELVAHAIHAMSPRAPEAFVEVNCAAIPEELIESELFGHIKGSFTGAHENKTGKFRKADAGTLFLDEVGDMSLRTQAKVLRALEEQRFEAVGASEWTQVDVRVIAATNKVLEQEIERGNFREDLFYRLNVIPFHVPPLRDRREDIPLLADYFLREFTHAYGRKRKELTASAYQLLGEYHWPGNIRELRNLIERIVILNPQVRIDARHIPLQTSRRATAERVTERFGSLQEVREAVEREYILRKLDETNGNVTRTAELLGLERSNLYRKMKTLGIGPKE